MALIVISRLLICAIGVIAFQHIRQIIALLMIVLTIVDIILLKKHKKKMITALILNFFTLSAIILVITAAFPLHDKAELLRFNVLEDSYAKTAESAEDILVDAENTFGSEYKLNSSLPLAKRNKLLYTKYGESIFLYYPTLVTSFSSWGYIYFSDSTARDILEHPSKYDSHLSDKDAFDYILDLNQNWAYVKLY